MTQSPPDPIRDPEQIKLKEIEEIGRRRGASVPADNLVGLAFSGGGIRSATLNLGVLQALRDLNLLERIDYLSTVSGGGYIGAWLSANCRRHAGWLQQGANWDPSIGHLRRFSNYLSPQLGLLSADTWAMVMIWIRNTLLIQTTLILAIAVGLLVPRLLFPVFHGWHTVGNFRWLTIILMIAAVAGIAGNQWRVSRAKDKIGLLTAAHAWIGLLAGLPMIAIVAALQYFGFYTPFPEQASTNAWSVLAAVLLVAGGSLMLPSGVILVGLLARLLQRFTARRITPPAQINYDQFWVQIAVVAPMMLASVLIASILWWESFHSLKPFDTYGQLLANAWKYWPFPLTVALSCLLLLSISSVRKLRSLWGTVAALLGGASSCATLYALLCAIVLFFQSWTSDDQYHAAWRAFVWGSPMVLYAISLAIVVLIGILGRQSPEGSREWWSRLGAWLAIYGAAWMIVTVASIYGPFWVALLLATLSAKLPALGAWIATTAGGLMAGRSASTNGNSPKSGTAGAKEILAKVAPFVFIAGLLILVSCGLQSLLVLNSNPDVAAEGYWYQISQIHLHQQTLTAVVLGAAVALLLLFAGRVDINEFSLNAFYRSRLVRCFLGATRLNRNPQKFTQFDEKDDLAMARLKSAVVTTAIAPNPVNSSASVDEETGETGPYHIVNCALNLGGSSDLSLHTRHSANFILTPLFCGSAYTPDPLGGNDHRLGYVPTDLYGGPPHQPTLGQAISVSGAAASPNMGYHTSTVVAFLMTIFNARLGWWFPNPALSSWSKTPAPWFNLLYLAMEAFGLAADQDKFLAISDGGHFENLAAYELVRRRCKVIIIGDGECDVDMKFEGLGTLIRMCRVDFGAEIDIDVSSLKKDAEGWSRGRCAVGTIRYALRPGETERFAGTLIYLKASMTGHERDTSIRQYKDAHPDFPHESTGDQFYSEDQFESYRLLGYEIARSAFEPAIARRTDFAAMAQELHDIWSPTLRQGNQFTLHSSQLAALWKDIAAQDKLTPLDRVLFGVPIPAADRGAFYTGMQMLQLMENVYLDLRLDQTWDHPDNAGWQRTFRVWSQSPSLQETWKTSSDTFGLRFRYFCRQTLGLP